MHPNSDNFIHNNTYNKNSLFGRIINPKQYFFKNNLNR